MRNTETPCLLSNLHSGLHRLRRPKWSSSSSTTPANITKPICSVVTGKLLVLVEEEIAALFVQNAPLSDAMAWCCTPPYLWLTWWVQPVPICNIAQHSPNSNSGGVAIQLLVWFRNPVTNPWHKRYLAVMLFNIHPVTQSNSLKVVEEIVSLFTLRALSCAQWNHIFAHTVRPNTTTKLIWSSPPLSSENLFHGCLVLPRESLILLQI